VPAHSRQTYNDICISSRNLVDTTVMKPVWRKHLIICLFLGLLAVPIYFLDRALLGGGGSSNWITLDFRGLIFRLEAQIRRAALRKLRASGAPSLRRHVNHHTRRESVRISAVVVRLVNVHAIDDAVTRAVRRIRKRVRLVVPVIVAPVRSARKIITAVIRGHGRRFRATRDKDGDDARAKQRQQHPSPAVFAFAFPCSFHQLISHPFSESVSVNLNFRFRFLTRSAGRSFCFAR
jgi:hypothetical protein